MDNTQQIKEWYTRIYIPSYDDIEDFRVMLLDMDDHSDANAALDGIATNLLENGWKEDLMQMLVMASRPDCEPQITDKAMLYLVTFLILYDSIFRQCKQMIDSVLDILSYLESREQMHHYLTIMERSNSALKIMDLKCVDIHKSLIFDLASVQRHKN